MHAARVISQRYVRTDFQVKWRQDRQGPETEAKPERCPAFKVGATVWQDARGSASRLELAVSIARSRAGLDRLTRGIVASRENSAPPEGDLVAGPLPGGGRSIAEHEIQTVTHHGIATNSNGEEPSELTRPIGNSLGKQHGRFTNRTIKRIKSAGLHRRRVGKEPLLSLKIALLPGRGDH